MALFDGVAPEKVIGEWRKEFQLTWRDWHEKCLRQRRLIQTNRRTPSGVSLTGNPKSDIKAAREYFSQYVSAALALMHRSVIGRVLNGKVIYRTALIGETRTQREAQSDLERVVGSFLEEQNRKVARYGRGTSWLRRAAFHAFVDGKIINRVHVHASPYDSKILAVDWDILDPLTVAHDFDSWPRRFVREFRVGAKDAVRIVQSKGLTLPKGFDPARSQVVGMTECWAEEALEGGKYAVWEITLVEGKIAGDPADTPFDRLPIVVSSAHSELGAVEAPEQAPSGVSDPSLSQRGLSSDEILYHAQGFYTPIEHIHGIYNEFMSIGMEGMTWGLNKARYVYSDGGRRTLTPAELGPGATVNLDPTKSERVEPDTASLVGIAELLTAFVGNVNGEMSKLVSPALLGHNEPGESGFHYNSRVGHAQSVLVEPVVTVANSILFSDEETLHQWRAIPGLKVRFQGKAASGMESGHFILQEYSIDRLPKAGAYALQVDVSPNIPVDDMVALTYVLQATNDRPGVGPVLDMVAGLQYLGIEDAKSVADRIKEQRLENNPLEQQRLYVEWLREKAEALDGQAARDKEPRLRVQGRALALLADALEVRWLGSIQPQAPGGAVGGNGAKPSNMVLPPQGTTENPNLLALANGRQAVGTQGRPPSGNGAGPAEGGA